MGVIVAVWEQCVIGFNMVGHATSRPKWCVANLRCRGEAGASGGGKAGGNGRSVWSRIAHGRPGLQHSPLRIPHSRNTRRVAAVELRKHRALPCSQHPPIFYLLLVYNSRVDAWSVEGGERR
jgi:hypothetical protein